MSCFNRQHNLKYSVSGALIFFFLIHLARPKPLLLCLILFCVFLSLALLYCISHVCKTLRSNSLHVESTWWHNRLIFCLCCQHPLWVMVRIPAFPLPIQLSAYGLRRQWRMPQVPGSTHSLKEFPMYVTHKLK